MCVGGGGGGVMQEQRGHCNKVPSRFQQNLSFSGTQTNNLVIRNLESLSLSHAEACEERQLTLHVQTAETYQPAHLYSLIRAFPICIEVCGYTSVFIQLLKKADNI